MIQGFLFANQEDICYIELMLTFTHTYLLNLAYYSIHRHKISLKNGAMILGNVIPDFVTHLGRDKYQALAHNLQFLTTLKDSDPMVWGAIFHILCDNYSTLGRISFDGNYHNFPKAGFIEQLSQQVIIKIPLRIPKRRILQCAFDILVLRKERNFLIKMLTSAKSYLDEHYTEVIKRVSNIYRIGSQQLEVGIKRFANIYGADFIEKSASESYRLFPLIRNLLQLDTLTDPNIILQEIENHFELMELLEQNMVLIEDQWLNLLEETIQVALKYPGMNSVLEKI